ncbi:GntR family transcriptional regulator [Saccharopolyspora griseoalba]|uniref:GntR family transcriptional regulator n=1 Tax=Saccharopolyspora griseoalba TaxID=1431848 RepID=A0ABW2LSH9_9PSEU
MASKREQIAADLRGAITNGELEPGARLPTEDHLAGTYNVSRDTVRWAIQALRADGLVLSEQGVGTFVADTANQPPKHIRRYSPARLAHDEREANRGAHLHDGDATVHTRVYFEPVTEALATEMGLEPGDEITVRSRVMSLNGVPTKLATSRLPRDITRGTRIEKVDTDADELLTQLEEAGFTLANPIERVTFGTARSTESSEDALNIKTGDPVVRITRLQTDAHGRVLEHTQMTMLVSYELTYEIPVS